MKEMVPGALCDGQLAMMTGEAADKIGVKSKALGLVEKSPASYAMEHIHGDYNNPEDQRAFSQVVDSFVFDTDHVQQGILQELHDNGFLIVPNPGVNKIIQHRIDLKQRLNDAGIPTARWLPVQSRQEAKDALISLGGDIVLKTTTEGFDGRGNAFVNSERSLEEAFENFGGRELIAEQRLQIGKELAMMIARDVYGNKAFYPIVESFHKDGMLEYTFLPAMINKQAEQQAMGMADQLLDAFDGPALIGAEFILTQDGQMVVNEIAGRPHNTGHYTIEAVQTSQFENLVRIATRQSLGSTELLHPDQMVMMHNLNGGTLTDVSKEDYQNVAELGGYLHWYHKTPRPQRKRGHITLVAEKGEGRAALMQKAQQGIKAINFI